REGGAVVRRADRERRRARYAGVHQARVRARERADGIVVAAQIEQAVDDVDVGRAGYGIERPHLERAAAVDGGDAAVGVGPAGRFRAAPDLGQGNGALAVLDGAAEGAVAVEASDRERRGRAGLAVGDHAVAVQRIDGRAETIEIQGGRGESEAGDV